MRLRGRGMIGTRFPGRRKAKIGHPVCHVIGTRLIKAKFEAFYEWEQEGKRRHENLMGRNENLPQQRTITSIHSSYLSDIFWLSGIFTFNCLIFPGVRPFERPLIIPSSVGFSRGGIRRNHGIDVDAAIGVGGRKRSNRTLAAFDRWVNPISLRTNSP